MKAKVFFDPESLFLVKLTTQNLFIRYFKCVKKNRPILVRIQLTLMAYNTCTCTNVLRHVLDLFKLIPNVFNVRQRVTGPLFHTSSYYLKDWIKQGAY